MPQCQGKTKQGLPCRKLALLGKSFCKIHKDQKLNPQAWKDDKPRRGRRNEDRGIGRPSLISEQRIERIASFIRAGNYIGVACEHCGIHQATYNHWKNRGEVELQRRQTGEKPDPDEDLYVLFFEKITQARAASEVQSVLKIKQLGTDENVNHRTQLLANQFFLERSFASRWSRASRNQYQADLNVTGDLKTDQPAVTINFANISLDQLEALGYPDDGYDDEA